MANKRPDIYEHNNPDYAFVDSDFVRGGFRSKVNSLVELYDLYASKSDQMKEHSTIIYVTQEDSYYILTDVTNADNQQGWSNPFVSLTDIFLENTILRSTVTNTPHTFEYQVSVIKYIVDGVLYQTPVSDNTIELIPPIGNDRIDVIALDFSNPLDHKIVVLTGDESQSPIKPTLDFDTQLEITFVLLKDGDTEPDGIRSKIIYNENLGEPDEAIASTPFPLAVDLENTEQFYLGSKSIKATNDEINYPSENVYIEFNFSTPFLPSEFDKCVLHAYSQSIGSGSSNVPSTFQLEFYAAGNIHAATLQFSPDGSATIPEEEWTMLIADFATMYIIDQQAYEQGISKIRLALYKTYDYYTWFDYIYFQGGIDTSVPSVHNSLSGKQGGDANADEFYHLDKYNYDKINSFEISDIFKGNTLIMGGFHHIEDYKYYVWAERYIINNILYTTFFYDDNVNLNPNTGNEDRIDVIAINNNQQVVVIEGTPSLNPVKPDIDHNTQLEVTFILVKANTTEPDDVEDIILYDENLQQPTEANTTTNAPTRVDFNDTSEYYSGTKSLSFTNSNNADRAVFQLQNPFLRDDVDSLVFSIKLKNNLDHLIAIYKYPNGYDGYSGKPLILKHGKYGFNRFNISQWQIISIPVSHLSLLATPYDTFAFINGCVGASFNIDKFYIQKNNGTISEPVIIEKTSDIPINDGATGVSPYAEIAEVEALTSTKQPKDLLYATITAMLADQSSQADGVVIRVDDASADTRITFPTGANKVAYYQKLVGSTASLIDDYVLNSAPFGNVATGLYTIPQSGADEGKLDLSNPLGLDATTLINEVESLSIHTGSVVGGNITFRSRTTLRPTITGATEQVYLSEPSANFDNTATYTIVVWKEADKTCWLMRKRS